MSYPLDEMRSVQRADVYKAGVLAGSLVRRPGGVSFIYEPDYRSTGGPPVAFTLPLCDEPIDGASPGAVPPFFAGLLPEGRRLDAVRRAVKTSADDELSLLLAVGADAVGDVQVVPEGEHPAEIEARVVVESWEDVGFDELVGHGSGELDRVALPGVQDKASARMISLPVASAGNRFILKLDPPEFPHLVANEKFFLDAARVSSIDVADAELIHDREGRPGLLVRRFDRASTSDGNVVLRAQEDACQVMGRYPADKYRLSAEAVLSGLAHVCRSRPVAGRALLQQVVFAYLTCNGDAHAKNFSVLHAGEWKVAPAYDLPSSHPYGDHTLALSIAGKTREDVGREDVLELAGAVGVPERAAGKTIDALLDACDAWMPELDTLPFDGRAIHKLRKAVEYRRTRLLGSG